MKATILLFLTITLLSCSQKLNKTKNKIQLPEEKGNIQIKTTNENEKFETMNSDEINRLLKGMSENLSAQDVMKLYRPEEIEKTNEGNEKIEIFEKNAENGNILITLIHDNLLDDSLRGEKYIMELKRTNDKWTVISIKNNWRCWNGRGHTDWGIERCR